MEGNRVGGWGWVGFPLHYDRVGFCRCTTCTITFSMLISIQTPMKVSILVRCPHFRGIYIYIQELLLGKSKVSPQENLSGVN